MLDILDLVCMRCGSINDASFTKNGPHIQANCNGCGRYIKFVPMAQVEHVNEAMRPKPIQKFNDMIKTQLIGALGRDAEVKAFSGQNGSKATNVINFTVAVNIGYGDKKETLWVDCAKWGENTKIAEYLKKGTKVHVAGDPGIRQWESNGKSGVSFTLRVDHIELLGGNKQEEGAASVTKSDAPQTQGNTVIEDDLPF